jgi:methionine-S-sulfoxide reductase
MSKSLRFLALAIGIALPAGLAAEAVPPGPGPKGGLELAIFAGGCFWCTEADFDKVDGVFMTVSGYIGGHTKNPTYKEVTTGATGHTEAVQITYDPSKVTYEQLVEHFWRTIDPTDKDGQFCDRGSSYRPEVFPTSDEQKKIAEASRARLERSGVLKKPVVVAVTSGQAFTKAEEYHQDFYKKNPGHYYRYRTGCGRDARLEQLWGKAGMARTN